MTTSTAVKRFHMAMLEVYRRAPAECDYRATRFLQMVNEKGGLETARYLLNSPNVSDGYTAHWEKGRLDLTVEALALSDEWRSLFTAEELEIARGRLTQYGFEG